MLRKVCSFFLQALQAAARASKSEDAGFAHERVADFAEVRRRGRTQAELSRPKTAGPSWLVSTRRRILYCSELITGEW